MTNVYNAHTGYIEVRYTAGKALPAHVLSFLSFPCSTPTLRVGRESTAVVRGRR